MKIVIFENTDKLHAVETAAQTAELLTAGGAELLTFNINELADAAAVIDGTDIIIVIGGDGTILKTAPLACEYDIPLLGINTGRLGFMASIERTELHLLDSLFDGSFSLSRRLRLVGEIWRGDEKITELTATNEISAVHPISKITDFTVRAKDNLPKCDCRAEHDFRTVCGFRADGLLIATPTGSTAYALANGGAIIEPNAVCMELTPICAHTLSMRPMIFSAETIIEITHDLPVPFNKDEPVRIFADGVAICEMTAGDTLYIRKSDKPLKLIDLKPNAFYESVNGKLFQSLK